MPMRKKTITSQSDPSIVTLTANIANTATPVATITVPRGTTYRLHNTNEIRGVSTTGTYIILDLKDANGQPISGASKVIVASRGPADEYEKKHRALPYSNWRDLTTTQQRNEDYRATLVSQTDLNTGPGLEIIEQHQVMLFVEGPTAVDWSKSFFQIDFEELN